MCGIVGIFDLMDKRSIDRDLLNKMNDLQFHRGPDGSGLHIEAGVGLGHRRLSIIDVASGAQPMFNEDESVVVTYNGEIYNFPELSDELKEAGHQFKTHSDTEVIVHAWEEWGEACVERFRGMFAFAIWDRNQQTLFLARDRLGKKPLYYSLLDNGLFIFSSELKALMAHDGLSRELDTQAVEDFFALGYVPDPKSIYTSVRKLSPGHTLTLVHGEQNIQPKCYWDISFADNKSGDIKQQTDMLISKLREAVDIRMLSEVPLGAFLSGGVDSSAIVAMMAGLSEKPVNTCSISFDDPKYNESEYADMIAERYKTTHVSHEVSSNDFDLIDQLAKVYDEPFADSSALPTYRVCELARKHVTVALSGDGGDEAMAGYRRHRLHMYEESLRQRLPLWLRRLVFGPLGALYPKMDWAPQFLRAKTTFQSLAKSSAEAYFHSMSIMTDSHRNKLYSAKMKSDLQGYNAVQVFNDHAKIAPTDDPLSLIQYLDIKTYLPGDILVKVDRASMANSLEVRAPMLDHEFVQWACGVPSNLRLNGKEGKYVLKKAMEPHLPNDVLYRKKMGFSVPISEWFRGPLKSKLRQSLLNGRMADSGLFNQDYIKQIIDEHQSERSEHSAMLWALLMFESFLSHSQTD